MKGDNAGPIVVFDGNCVLCSRVVCFILRHESAPVIRFASSQSPAGRALAAAHGLPPAALEETFLVVTGGTALVRSDAALEVARCLRWPWRALGALSILPRPVRDTAYSAVARHRYRIFGRMESCFIAPPAVRHRFLDLTPHEEPPS